MHTVQAEASASGTRRMGAERWVRAARLSASFGLSVLVWSVVCGVFVLVGGRDWVGGVVKTLDE